MEAIPADSVHLRNPVRPSESWGGSLEQLTAVVEVAKKPAEKKKKKGGNKKKAATKKDNPHREEL